MPKYSIGNHLFYAKANLEPTVLFSWTIIIVVLSYVLENLYVKFVKRSWGKTYDKIKQFKQSIQQRAII